MEPSIYSYSLCIALPLMLFFGFYFLLAPTSEKAIFNNYLRSRRIMGVAILLLAANYSVHFFFGIRFKNTDAAILMNLSTYFLCYWLFSSALTTLLDRFYITKRRLRTHICLWILPCQYPFRLQDYYLLWCVFPYTSAKNIESITKSVLAPLTA